LAKKSTLQVTLQPKVYQAMSLDFSLPTSMSVDLIFSKENKTGPKAWIHKIDELCPRNYVMLVMSVKSSLELVLYCFVYMPTLDKSYHIIS
jgi:hypothetical protein